MPAACSWLWIQFCHSWIRIFVSFAIFDGSILFRWIWPWANFRSAIQIYTFLAKRQSMSLAWFQTHFARRSSSSNIRKRSLVDCIGFEGNQATFYKRFWSHKEHSWCKLKVDPICWLLIIVQILLLRWEFGFEIFMNIEGFILCISFCLLPIFLYYLVTNKLAVLL